MTQRLLLLGSTPPSDRKLTTAATMERKETTTTSLFQDLKLKRKRVLDLLTVSEASRLPLQLSSASTAEGLESDQRSDVSAGDSAYVSDRGSESGASGSGEDTPAKKVRTETHGKSAGREKENRGREEEEAVEADHPWGGHSTGGRAVSMTPSGSSAPTTYMHGYLMPVSAGFPSPASMAANDLQFIPVMGLPTRGLFPAAGLIAAPPGGYLLMRAESIPTPAGPILAFPAVDSCTRATSSGNAYRQYGKNELGTSSSAAVVVKSSPPTSPKFKEPSFDDRFEKDQEFISHYTSGQFHYSGHLVENPHNKGYHSHRPEPSLEDSDGEEPMVCAICSDKATGLHYGIITCEGCKGFFKRTVQNKRVYSCVADGECEINKIQRNRCQYCRFKKCLQMGMVLAAVREDRMPGGRNSGAVYNLYKVKYKKHKRRDTADKALKQRLAERVLKTDSAPGCPHRSGFLPPDYRDPPSLHPQVPRHPCRPQYNPPSPSSAPYAAHPMVAVPPLQQSDSASEADTGIDVDGDSVYSSSTARGGSPSRVLPGYSPHLSFAAATPSAGCSATPAAATMTPGGSPCHSLGHAASHSFLVSELARKDSLLRIAEDYKIEQLAGPEQTAAEALCRVGDDIVLKLVQWMKRLPFHREIPLPQQTRILTAKWHELLLLIMTAYTPATQRRPAAGFRQPGAVPTFAELYRKHLTHMQRYLEKTFGKFFALEQLDKEIGGVMEQITRIILRFTQLGITRKELATLQVILLLTSDDSQKDLVTQRILRTYQLALRHYILQRFPSDANRFGDLLEQLPEIRSASHRLLHSKMIYIPFLLNC